MTALGGSIARFYGVDAPLYALFSDDRDFDWQARYLAAEIAGGGAGRRFLELFAGPARHVLALERNHGFQCTAIDASEDMRRIATGPGGLDPGRYCIAQLPDLPTSEQLGGPFDGASILRYSVGYLTPIELGTLLSRLAPHMRPGARVVLELHDLDLVRGDFRGLEIRERTVRDREGHRLRCLWPAAPLRWSQSDWVVEMDVVVQQLDADCIVAERRFTSVERIYARDEVYALAVLSGLYRPCEPKATTEAFPGGQLAVLERLPA